MDIKKIMTMNPIISDMADYKEVFWLNPKAGQQTAGQKASIPFGMADIEEAEPDSPVSHRISRKFSRRQPSPAES